MSLPADASSPRMRRSYAVAVLVEIAVLAALWALGRVFS
jgi:predicted membrane-bound mannosyltransferase